MRCPYCGGNMRSGDLAVNGRALFLAEVVWEPAGRRWGGSKRVLWPGPVGYRSRPAAYCDSCEAVVVAPPRPAG